MKILLVHQDKYPWATTTRANNLKKLWIDDQVDIAYFRNLPDGSNYDIIHFLFSGGIGKNKDYILKFKDKTFTTLASQRTLDEYYDKKEVLIQIYKNTVCCVAQNPSLAKKLQKLINQDNVVYMPNGVDTKLFNRKFVVGFVGAHADNSDHKGFNLIRKACEELGLELRTAHSGFQNDVRPISEMPKFYQSIDCLVLASISEGCNNPTLEALAMNKPVISTNVGIASELEGVILVERNVESIKKALRKFSGRIEILEKYSWEIIAKKYRDLYLKRLKLEKKEKLA